jgi:ABC-type multidrug transport system ATPase subunit
LLEITTSYLAVGGLNLKTPTGELFDFIGLNGGGKITTIKLLAGQLNPFSRNIHIDDLDIKQDPIE